MINKTRNGLEWRLMHGWMDLVLQKYFFLGSPCHWSFEHFLTMPWTFVSPYHKHFITISWKCFHHIMKVFSSYHEHFLTISWKFVHHIMNIFHNIMNILNIFSPYHKHFFHHIMKFPHHIMNTPNPTHWLLSLGSLPSFSNEDAGGPWWLDNLWWWWHWWWWWWWWVG